MLQDHPKITNNSLFDSPSSGFPIGKFQIWYLHKIHKYITSSVIYSIIMTIFQSIYFMKYHHFWWLNTSKNTIVCHGWSFLSRHLGSPVSPHHGLTTSLRLLGVRSPSAAEMRSEIPYSLHCFRGQFAGKTWKNTVFHGKKTYMVSCEFSLKPIHWPADGKTTTTQRLHSSSTYHAIKFTQERGG
jgi:hypothetical protein